MSISDYYGLSVLNLRGLIVKLVSLNPLNVIKFLEDIREVNLTTIAKTFTHTHTQSHSIIHLCETVSTASNPIIPVRGGKGEVA